MLSRSPDGVSYRCCDCRLGEKVVSLVVNLGAKVSMLCQATYTQGLSRYQLHPPDRRLMGYAGAPITLLGMIFVPVRYRDVHLIDFPFYVAEEGTDLLELDLFEALGFRISLVAQRWMQWKTMWWDALHDDNDLGGQWKSKVDDQRYSVGWESYVISSIVPCWTPPWHQ